MGGRTGAGVFDLSGKAAIVTGSGRGLGRAMARGLAEAGAAVTICGRSADVVAEAAAELRAEGCPALEVVFDATDRKQCQRLIEATVAEFGRLDVMVVNHGIGGGAPAEEVEPEAWARMMETNLTSAFACAQLAGRQMIAQGAGGSIVMISSTGSLVTFDRLTGYGTAKAGVDHMARHLAAEWGRHGIRVNVIAPGYMSSHMKGSAERYNTPELLAEIRKRTPLGRKGAPEELVGPVVFLASEASSFVTGHVLPVDGGWCIR
jgi:NAD(P)-dependent dehydrogenase (short-subunit alcohol dehydrogenase family)